jgi:hypothetical protein
MLIDDWLLFALGLFGDYLHLLINLCVFFLLVKSVMSFMIAWSVDMMSLMNIMSFIIVMVFCLFLRTGGDASKSFLHFF